MAAPWSIGLCGRGVSRALNTVLRKRPRELCLSSQRRYVTKTTGHNLQFKLDERTAHSSLDLFKKDTGVIYRILGLDPSLVLDNPERFGTGRWCSGTAASLRGATTGR
ncbi:hypothetical protein AGOR_G00133000 [Albula goreensis]|uniref:Uncharacterized protein n=1 Tax=Albula goreensis TaxID=1534307 RepID=A0A8T3D481_9TELE|nr:hypothetical protein AGOR_G00133000 [Albula goreensis]